MKTKILISALLSFSFYLLSSQVPQGFNYQAVALDGTTPISTALPVRITIQSDAAGGTIFWVEEHASVIPNSAGLFSLVVGSGVRQSASTVAFFSDIDWSVSPKYIKTEINYSGWKTMGASGLWAVPYSMVAGELGGALDKLQVAGKTTSLEEALFEVKNNTGQTIFAVYNEGVRIYVDDGEKGAKGGFAIGGFDIAKAPGQEYFRVTRDSTRVYMSQPVKGAKGGFAIGGFSGAKTTVDNLMDLTKNNYFIGHQSGMANTSGLYNSFIGYQAGLSNLSGGNNVFMGFNAGYANVGGSDNIFIGNQSGKASNGYSNVFIGHTAGISNTAGSYNIFLGEISGYNNKDGSSNIFFGYETGSANISGGDNVLIGSFCANNIKDGNGNVMLGVETGGARTTGSYNVLLGSWSGGGGSTGTENVMLGTNAGYNTTGDKNVFLGSSAGFNEAGSNKLYIDNSSTASPLIYGDFTDGSEKLIFNGKVGIGTSPLTKFAIAGLTGSATGSTLIINGNNVYFLTSKRESKEDILPLTDEFTKILHAEPVSFTDRATGMYGIGYIAEDFEKAGLQNLLVYENGKLVSLRYDLISVYNLEIIKNQQSRIEAAEKENIQLKSELQSLTERMTKLEAILTETGNK